MIEARLKRIQTGSADVISFELPVVYHTEYAKLVKSALKIGDEWAVTLKPYRKRRSTGDQSQNHHFNAHVQQIAYESGNDFEDVKLFIKRAAMRDGLPAKTNNDGSIKYRLSDGQPDPISEADMDSQQCGWCIEACHYLAADLGIILNEGIQ